MKKIVTCALVILALCANLSPSQAVSVDFGDLFGSLYNTSSSIMPQTINMPKEFSITYEYTEDGRYREVTLEKDSDDNYHYKDADNEYLFVRDGNGYRIAIGTVNGFIYKDNDKYSFDYVKTQTTNFWSLAAPLEDITIGTTVHDGNGEICGRKTDKFKVEFGMNYSISGFSMGTSDTTYYEFDIETGICMASSASTNVSVMGLNTENEGSKNFVCISFLTDHISLPTV